jgi:hypothetical protein
MIDLSTFKKYKKAYKITCELSEFPLKELKRRYRILAQKYHPDKGGKHEHFIFVNDAYKYLKKFCSEEIKEVPKTDNHPVWDEVMDCWNSGLFDGSIRARNFHMYQGNRRYERKPY